MNGIKEIIDSVDSFDQFSELIQSREFFIDVNNVLLEYGIKGKTRLFLSACTIHKFPRDTIGNLGEMNVEGFQINRTEQDEKLIEKSTKVFDIFNKFGNGDESCENFTNILNEFIQDFNEWKKTDLGNLKDSILKEYHNLTVSIMNAPEESKDALEECKKNLLETAEKVAGKDFVNYILEHVPVVLDVEEVAKQYSNAFWDLLADEYKEKNYDKIFVVLEHIVTLLSILYTKESEQGEIKEHIDVDFIKQQLEHDAYSAKEMYNLCQYIMGLCKKAQAPEFDKNIEILENSLREDNFLPIFLREISLILEITTQDVLSLRQKIEEERAKE